MSGGMPRTSCFLNRLDRIVVADVESRPERCQVGDNAATMLAASLPVSKPDPPKGIAPPTCQPVLTDGGAYPVGVTAGYNSSLLY
jgi:hypothetical protein